MQADDEHPSRSAVLVGNSKYEASHGDGAMMFPPSATSSNDVDELGAVLQNQCGFQVTTIKDVKKRKFAPLGKLLAQSFHGKENSICIFYYSGHAVTIEGETFLAPIDARQKNPAALVSLNKFLREAHDVAGGTPNTMEKTAASCSAEPAPGSLLLVVLDCCRTRLQDCAQVGEGELRITSAPRYVLVNTNMCIVYPCDAGEVARESVERDLGTFTAAFIDALRIPGLKWDALLDKCKESCTKLSRGKQRVWTYDCATGLAQLVLHPQSEETIPTQLLLHPQGEETIPAQLPLHPQGEETIPTQVPLHPQGEETIPTHLPQGEETIPTQLLLHPQGEETSPTQLPLHPQGEETSPTRSGRLARLCSYLPRLPLLLALVLLLISALIAQLQHAAPALQDPADEVLDFSQTTFDSRRDSVAKADDDDVYAEDSLHDGSERWLAAYILEANFPNGSNRLVVDETITRSILMEVSTHPHISGTFGRRRRRRRLGWTEGDGFPAGNYPPTMALGGR